MKKTYKIKPKYYFIITNEKRSELSIRFLMDTSVKNLLKNNRYVVAYLTSTKIIDLMERNFDYCFTYNLVQKVSNREKMYEYITRFIMMNKNFIINTMEGVNKGYYGVNKGYYIDNYEKN